MNTTAEELPSQMEERHTMNGKEVHVIDAKTVINFASGFRHKLLCDGLTFSAGSACAFSCSFCYVAPMMAKSPHLVGIELPHQEVVIRRRNALAVMRAQLCTSKGVNRWNDASDQRVIFSSPLVDAAANMELARETVALTHEILERTQWQVRLLSKSPLLRQVAQGLDEINPDATRRRVIFGLSTGTRDDALAAAFEQGCPRVSKRLEALRWLQDQGFRTFGMICPSLPQESPAAYSDFAAMMADALRVQRCEHVWAEVLNVRGNAVTLTAGALAAGGFGKEAEQLVATMDGGLRWEEYARATFAGHVAQNYAPGKLRFMQYVTKLSGPWWEARKEQGAVVL